MQYKDYYQILGVDKKATEDEIKKSFKKLAKKYHPDVNKEKGAESKFKDINEAYEVLGDKDKRHKYDTLGANWDQYADFGGGGNYRYQDMGDINGRTFTGSDFSDFFEIFFGGKGDSFSNSGFGGFGGQRPRSNSRASQNPFNQQQQQKQKSTVPQDEKIPEVDVSLKEAFNGVSKLISLDMGFGNKKDIKVNIPKGAEQGMKMRIPVQGQDVYFKIKINDDDIYKLDKKDITVEMPITDYEAVLGVEIQVPTLSGSAVNLKIPAHTQAGKKFRLKGLGMPDRKTEHKGDMYVKIKIVIPNHLTEKEKELFTQLKDLREGKDKIRDSFYSQK